MLASLAFILIIGILCGKIFSKFNLPSLLGMIIIGIIISPYALNLVNIKVLDVSSEIRTVALVIILTRAGLSLNLNDLKKVGRPAILMCFVPATFEILGTVLIAPKLLGISTIDAAVMGCVVAAVSPAVIVPRMIKLMEKGYGKEKSIPQMVLAGASVDDIFVIVLFTVFSTLSKTGNFEYKTLLNIPISIILGIIIGSLIGYMLTKFYEKINVTESMQLITLLCTSFALLELEKRLSNIIAFSALLAIMSIGIVMNKYNSNISKTLSQKYNKLWLVGEVFLFVLVGVAVDLNYVFLFGWSAVALVFLILIFRNFGVTICLFKTNLKFKEKIFCVISYIPKATVQAAIGAVPLAMGLSSGKEILTVAVLSILITAPIGAIGIDLLHEKLLEK